MEGCESLQGSEFGMCTLEQYLQDLVVKQIIEQDAVYRATLKKEPIQAIKQDLVLH